MGREITKKFTESLLDAAIEAAHLSGKILLNRFHTKLRVSLKADSAIVTDADVESELAAINILKKAFPDFGVLAEETGTKDAHSPGRWILDPLDGTTNYAHGLPIFCVSIAAEWEGKIVAGVIYHPPLNETYTAIRGSGAFVNNQRMQVASTTELKDSLLTTGFHNRKDIWLNQETDIFRRLSNLAQGVRRPGSAALDLAQVARGVFDGFWERGLAAWDVAAGSLMVEEAGGKVTNFYGNELDINCGELLASNGSIHSDLQNELTRSVQNEASQNQSDLLAESNVKTHVLASSNH